MSSEGQRKSPRKPGQQDRRSQTSRPKTRSIDVTKRTRNETHISGVNFDSADQVAAFPVEETDTTLSLDTEQNTACEALGLEANIETAALLLKVLEDLHTSRGFTNSEIVAIVFGSPREVESRAECLIAPRQSSLK